MGGSAPRLTARRVAFVGFGVTVAAVVVFAAAYAWWQPDDVDTVVGVVSVAATLAATWLAWAGFRADRSGTAEGGVLDLAGVADQLAGAVRRQWQDEAALRRLNDPHPLPVRWAEPDDASLTVGWPAIRTLATDGAGWPRPSRREQWAAGSADLAGAGGSLADLLDRVPTGRLVVLGEPGSGKTMLAVRLVLDLLSRRCPGAPVPLLLPLASWNPSEEDLGDWMASRLVIDHPGLAARAPAGRGGNRVDALRDDGLILPILDGLDEIPDAVRGPAIARINAALRPGEKIVLTCRTDPYRDAVAGPGRPPVRLAGAAAVSLQPLGPADVADYLLADAGSAADGRWGAVTAVLCEDEDHPLTRTLRTPLMVDLARTVYNPMPDEHVGDLPNPAELCDADRFPGTEALQRHLFDAFIPAAYRRHPDPGRRSRWTAGQAERWLSFLARHMTHTVRTNDLAWWQLPSAGPRALAGLAFGVFLAVAEFAVLGAVGFLVPGLVIGAAILLLAAIGTLSAIVLARTRGSRSGPTLIVAALALGLAVEGAIAGLVPHEGYIFADGVMLGVPFVSTLVVLAVVALGIRRVGPPRRAFPRPSAVSIAVGVLAGVPCGLVVSSTTGWSTAAFTGLVLAVLATTGIAVAIRISTAAPNHRARPAVLAAANGGAASLALALGVGVGMEITGNSAGLAMGVAIGASGLVLTVFAVLLVPGVRAVTSRGRRWLFTARVLVVCALFGVLNISTGYKYYSIGLGVAFDGVLSGLLVVVFPVLLGVAVRRRLAGTDAGFAVSVGATVVGLVAATFSGAFAVDVVTVYQYVDFISVEHGVIRELAKQFFYQYTHYSVLLVGVLGGMLPGTAAYLTIERDLLPSRTVRLRPRLASALLGLGTGLLAGVVAVDAVSGQRAIVIGLVVGIGTAIATGLEGAPASLTASSSPLTLLRRDRRAAQVVGLAAGVGAVVLVGIAVGMTSQEGTADLRHAAGDAFTVGLQAGVAVGLVTALSATLLRSAWGPFLITRVWLALRGKLPWRLIPFLVDAHRLGVLRQVGAVYQFRHAELQHHIVNRSGVG